MAKIKITKEIKELDGKVHEKYVAPFGTSAHITFPRQHIGKVVDVLVPTDVRYKWVLSDDELNTTVKASENVLKINPNSKMTFHLEESIKNIQDKTFLFEDLINVLSLLRKDKKNIKIIEKIKYYYYL